MTQGLGPVVRSVGALAPQAGSKPQAPENAGFKDMLLNALGQVENLQKESDTATMRLVTGQAEDVHQVVIAGEKATLSLQMAVAVRNKVIEAYQEIMRMQV